MALRSLATTVLLLTLNLLLFTLVSSTSFPSPPTKPKDDVHHKKSPPVPATALAPAPAPAPSEGTCPKDTLKFGVCANLLNGLLGLVVGTPPKEPCCSLLGDLVELEAAVCLCTAVKANVLGIKLNILVDLSLLLNYCGKKVPKGFECA